LKIEFSIRSSTHYITFLRRLISVLNKMRPGAFNCEAKARCAVALVEAVNNAIFHAHGCDEMRWIDISIELKRTSVVMKVADSGKGFTMTEDGMPPIDSNHGRGLFIIKSLMHEVDYTIGWRNVLKMVYYL